MRTRALTFIITMAILASATITDASQSWAAGNQQSGGCGTSGYPAGYGIWCQNGGSGPGAAGSPGTVSDPGGGTVNTPCALYPIAGNPAHLLRVCPLPNPNGGLRYAVNQPGATSTVVTVGAGTGGGPPTTPQELLAWARGELTLPLPAVRTAPPRGSDGLAGLPEWFWVEPAQWHPMSAQVHVGGVWAQVTARPSWIQIQPGTGPGGMASRCNGVPGGGGCRCPGPGTAYDPHLSAGAQSTECAVTYDGPSDGLPGDVYQVSVSVVWTAWWRGPGGAGGMLPPLGRTTVFALPVAEAQALNPGS